MLAVKRSLTQTEKQKYLLDDPGTIFTKNQFMSCMSLKFYEDKLYECQQNLIESRKYEEEIRQLERTKTKSMAKLNGEKHVIKMKYKDLIKTDMAGSDPTFLTQPGFRYKRNGDLKPVKSYLSDAKARLRKGDDASSLMSTGSIGSRSTQSLQSGDSIHQSLHDTRKILAKLEQNIRNNKQYCGNTDEDENELLNVEISVRDIKNSLAKVRQNFQSSHIEPKQIEPIDDFEQKYRQKSHAACKRFFRQCSRASCEACESRLKCKRDNLVKRPTKAPLLPWKAAPSGHFVSKIEQKASSPRKTSSARPYRSDGQFKEYKPGKSPSTSKRGSMSATPLRKSRQNLFETIEQSTENDIKEERPIVNPILERFLQRQHGSTHSTKHAKSASRIYDTPKPASGDNTESEHVLRIDNINSARNIHHMSNTGPHYKVSI